MSVDTANKVSASHLARNAYLSLMSRADLLVRAS